MSDGTAGAGPLRFFALSATRRLGERVAAVLGQPLAKHEERVFEDGEYKLRPLEVVSGCDVFVLQSLHAGPDLSADDKLNRLLFFAGTLKDAGAARVTAVAPYLCYARKDRRTKWQDPLTLRYVASLFGAVDTDVVATLDVHNEMAFENAFRCRTVALTAAPLLVVYAKSLEAARLCIVSPDPGGVKRAQLYAEALERASGRAVARGFVEKRRSAGKVETGVFVGDAKDATVLIIDDLIASGGTMMRAARAVRDQGARHVVAFATHGLFTSGAEAALADPAIDRVVTTDVVPSFRLPEASVRRKLDVLPAASLLGDAIRRLHANLSLAELDVF